MGHYKSNIRDLHFNLFELFDLDKVLEEGDFGDLDHETAVDMLREVKALAEGPIAESFTDADRNPPVFDPETHSVTIPESFTKSYNALIEGGWDKIGIEEELGGLPAPRSLYWAIGEMILGANPPVFMYAAGSGFANIFFNNGTEEQKKWAAICSERGWGATMVLTEPDAGSDVGAARTKAVKQEDGTWHIDGVKRFITSADQDMTENIFHLVLARPEGAKPGTKGLSLFFVPKFHFDHETGELGERNGVFVTNVEHKMGIKASATCELSFGQHGTPAVGWLVGEVHDGIAQMFDVIEHARMMVGTKAISTLSTGYLNALDYAKERVQGADLTQMTDKTAPRVTITHHPDVRRSLMTQKAYAEGLRAVYLYTASHQDAAAAQIVSGASPELAHKVNDLLLPIVKGVGSERAYGILGHESLQTLGGSGFLQDYPIEQYIRDSKIDSLYEGTTAIQAQDFFFRKIIRDKGQAFSHVAGEIAKFLDAEGGNGRLKSERALLKTAMDDVQTMTATLTGYLMNAQEDPKELYKVGLGSVRFLLSVGDLLIGWLLLRQAEVALAALDSGASAEDKPFYEGKVAVASFFAKNMLPELTTARVNIENIDAEIMEVDEAVF
ncbi:acyl-CoA dehydrogenase [Gordonia sp. Z-3]|jgi:alkylation response protein AidB-like acyl-CoA dehydrogenase|uniref:Broad-specificity linear acyl-CoA dehydrogenase FadE5 n=2 Tax=Gordonia TaxID=2053 RepID=A0A9X3D2Q1_9ACTN|nr:MULTISPECIES: acyl-CoA dehydrogenase [Gordonia]MAU80326.1 acyl-CoA dehydrogenase [Gordonia sp. (in: high G+C Gram-positive bacteria)]MCF3940974.1 acyl-CoA dehydrogenase [Gordonia tangerina]MCX2963737.1 acyl-CoA dehydrogenase [Gordonia aquimaris]MED5802264.1 acyl-CoA dehydrogenase [Gordonia sp. Z-3]